MGKAARRAGILIDSDTRYTVSENAVAGTNWMLLVSSFESVLEG